MSATHTVNSFSPSKSLMAKVCFLASGVVGLAMVAVVAIASPGASSSAAGKLPDPVPAAVSGPGPVTVSGPGDVTVVQVAYEPGQSSGWHTHAGIHAVAILSGTLTVYDGQCRAQQYGPGQPYVGGQELHLTRNETEAPVEMVVTYLNPSASAKADVAHPEGPPCARIAG